MKWQKLSSRIYNAVPDSEQYTYKKNWITLVTSIYLWVYGLRILSSCRFFDPIFLQDVKHNGASIES